MSDSMGVIGHHKIIEYFKQVTAADRLSHAYLFSGPEQVGKRTVALKLSADLLNTQVEKILTQPDFLLIEKKKDEKTGKTKKDITVDQMRQVKSFASGTSLVGGRKVVIIDNAHELSNQASNALLKTLEEPSSDVVIFLITHQKYYLPSTILSRTQVIHFSTVKQDFIASQLQKTQVSSEKIAQISKFAWGRPGRAIFWSQEIDEFEWFLSEVKRFLSLAGMSFCDKLKAVEDLFGDKTDHIAAREKLDRVLQVWQVLFSELVLDKSKDYLSTESLYRRLGSARAVEIFNLLVEARIDLKQNIHPRLLVENILLKIP